MRHHFYNNLALMKSGQHGSSWGKMSSSGDLQAEKERLNSPLRTVSFGNKALLFFLFTFESCLV